MKQLIFILAFFSVCFVSFCQNNNRKDTIFVKYNNNWEDSIINYVTDTIIPESGASKDILINGGMGYILLGTTILPTGNRWFEYEYGLYFDKVTKSDCTQDGEYAGDLEDHINSISMTDTSLIIDFNIIHNCCYEFLCDIDIDTSGTLNLITIGYGNLCACVCCFGLTYHFTIERNETEKDISDIKAVMIDNNRETLKEIKWK